MPYKLSDDGLCVMKDTGETVKCHPTHAEALAHMQALMVNVPEAKAAITKSEQDGDHPASHYLVVEDAQSPSTWHLRVLGLDGKPDPRLMGASWAALHGGYRGNAYEGPQKQAAIDKLKRLYAQEKMPTPDGSSAKAGARHSTGDIAKGRGVKQKAREIVQDMEDLGFPDAQNVGDPGEVPNALKAVSETDDELRVANYMILFGGRDLEGIGSPRINADGSRGEFFTAKTVIESEKTQSGKLMVDWEHATMRGRAKDGINPGEYLGYVDWKTARKDEKGWWVERVLSRRSKYVQWIAELIKAGLVGNSTEADTPRVITGKNGEIERWPLVRDTLTVSPMEPRMMTANVVTALKALGYDIEDNSATPQATGAGSAAEQSATQSAKGILDMDEKELIALLDAREAAKAAREKTEAEAEAARQAKEQERIAEAVKTEREKNEKEIAKLKAQYVASGRLPMGDPNGAPHLTRFADTRKYDGLSPADMAYMGALLGGAKALGAKPLSESGLKALAIKIAEDKSEAMDMTGQKVGLGEVGRAGLKAMGFEPADFLDATKSNEVNYSTLANYGDEWVGIEYSRRLWPAVRAATFVLDKLPQVEVPQGAESIIIPLESADPIFYKVSQTTDEDGTMKTPVASVKSSRLGTARNTLTVAKGGARTEYSGEMEEDSLIPWAAQLRQQMETATAENLEHAVIDGDTETGNSLNINTIASTPAGTEFYLLIDGLRKSPLVTTTANSRSASGTLVDTDFMDTAWLMGAAGKIGGDPTKVDFIVDPNVSKKVAYLASVKTKDVFTNATLENGLLRGIWAYKVYTSWFMHWVSTTNPLKCNTAGKVNLANQALNTTGAILAVRWDQWLFGWKRRIRIETVRIPRSDITEITATLRFGLLQRDTEGSAITYNVGV